MSGRASFLSKYRVLTSQVTKKVTHKVYRFKLRFKLPGKGPLPGGRNNVPRILPSFTGIRLTPSAMYPFRNVVSAIGCLDVSLEAMWS